MPDAARGTTPAAAKAFARYWVALLNYAGTSGDVKPMRVLASRSCTTCHSIERRVTRVYERGGHFVGGQWRPTSSRAVRLTSNKFLVSLGLLIPKQTIYESASASPQTSQSTKGNLDLWLLAQDGSWIVTRMDASQ